MARTDRFGYSTARGLVQYFSHMLGLTGTYFPSTSQDVLHTMTDDAREDEVGKVGPPASDRGVYGISVAAELSGISEQSLRLYERHGLLTPARSAGGTRRYSGDDLARLQRISELVAAGVNLAGIDRILSLEDRNAALDERNVTLDGDNDALRAESRADKLRKHHPSRGRVRGARTSAAGRSVAACDARLRHTTRDTRREIALRVVARRQPCILWDRESIHYSRWT